MPSEPKAPPLKASKAEHKKFAKEALAYEPYKREPEGGMHPSDTPPREDPKHKPKDDDE